jgi:enterochelin esterase-like enzyme
MKQFLLATFCVLLNLSGQSQDIPGAAYPVDPAQQTHADVPKGEIIHFEMDQSKIYPDTKRTIWVYIPAEYKPSKPACLYVDMDGIQFGAPTVFDYLIWKGEMPVTIGVFISSGTLMKDDKDALRFDRSHEFDSMNNDFVNFLLNEVLPEVEKKTTSDDRAIHFSPDANDHAIAGASSGAICAFTAAWQRPDAFSRVYSSIGTYVGMRGGDQYPVLVRKTEPKPLRIFLQDGSNDAWNPLFSNWYTSNLNMEAALSFAGYEVNHAWGNGGHDGVQATAIFPDVMRWLWKAWPQRVIGGKTHNDMLKTILPDSGAWELVNPDLKAVSIASAPGGNVLMQDSLGGLKEISPDGKVKAIAKVKPGAIASTTTGDIYVLAAEFVKYNSSGKQLTSMKLVGEKMVCDDKGNIYLTQSNGIDGKIELIRAGEKPVVVDEGVRFASAITLSPNHDLLLVAEDNTNWIYSFAINSDGTLKDKERWYWLHQTDNYGYSYVADLAMDDLGNLYAATNLGVQVCDQNGRVRAILQLPYGRIGGLCFGGADESCLYVICGDRIYKRTMKVKGAPAWAAPVQPKSQGAG